MYPSRTELILFQTKQNTDGQVQEAWGPTDVRITDLAVTPNYEYLVAIGMEAEVPPPAPAESTRASQSIAIARR